MKRNRSSKAVITPLASSMSSACNKLRGRLGFLLVGRGFHEIGDLVLLKWSCGKASAQFCSSRNAQNLAKADALTEAPVLGRTRAIGALDFDFLLRRVT